MNYYQKNRILLIGFFVVVLLLISIAGLVIPQSGKNFQKVFSNIPNDNILGLSKLIYNENEKKQDEFLSKLEQLNNKMMAEQARRLDRLEEINADLLRQVKVLKNSSPGLTLRDKLIYLHPYESSVRFPAYIWQSWKHGLNDDRFGELYREGERQWAAKNPGFAHEIFNDDTAFAVIKHLYISVPEVVEAYELLPEVILKMDFFRYLILYAKGGTYADIDTFPLQPIPNWIPENVTPDELGMIIGVESDSNSRNWREELVRRLQFGQFIIQAKPGHPILREMIARITENTLKLKSRPEDIPDDLKLTGTTNEKSLKILKWTGSGLWTDVIFNYFNNYIQSSIYQKISWKDFHDVKIPKLVSDVLVLPKSSFASDLEVSKDGKIEDNLAFAKHYASKLWKNT
ncbi:Piso0_005407 [Millerozyma farinosa CBS 7064]|uniref:Piso0_005407 protein n=1 Tax=Pichia sorbitophila (strain ATCC MYA-4447 / BCRC 22081 / CBS 7064 / NBRC 10061 / NRRL Y-12695) TaxID=559304 RepID=G8Y236_PICSO|nr:Piso0_005407 [Millerozyma farinosa CBS 7064]